MDKIVPEIPVYEPLKTPAKEPPKPDYVAMEALCVRAVMITGRQVNTDAVQLEAINAKLYPLMVRALWLEKQFEKWSVNLMTLAAMPAVIKAGCAPGNPEMHQHAMELLAAVSSDLCDRFPGAHPPLMVYLPDGCDLTALDDTQLAEAGLCRAVKWSNEWPEGYPVTTERCENCNAGLCKCDQCGAEWCLDCQTNPLTCPKCGSRPFEPAGKAQAEFHAMAIPGVSVPEDGRSYFVNVFDQPGPCSKCLRCGALAHSAEEMTNHKCPPL